MPSSNILIVPGYRGSGPDHWQTWLQGQRPGSTRIDGVHWDEPVLAHWAERVRAALARASEPQRVIAHSFGCLAAVVAAADRPEQVAELILVAPADPDRFDFTGLKPANAPHRTCSLSDALPHRPLLVSGCLIASRDDPWLEFPKAAALGRHWNLDIVDAGAAGHINAESGHGAWPWLLNMLEQRSTLNALDVRAVPSVLKKGRGSTLAAVRQRTREQLDKPHMGKSGV